MPSATHASLDTYTTARRSERSAEALVGDRPVRDLHACAHGKHDVGDSSGRRKAARAQRGRASVPGRSSTPPCGGQIGVAHIMFTVRARVKVPYGTFAHDLFRGDPGTFRFTFETCSKSIRPPRTR